MVAQNWTFDTGAASTAGVAFGNGEQMWLFKELAKACGAVIQASSDGTNVSNTPGNVNDQITTLAEMNTNHAWFTIKMLDGRIFIVRRGATATSWLVAYVPLDGSNNPQSSTVNGTTSAVPVFTTRFALVGTLPDTTASFCSSGSGARLLVGMDTITNAFFMGAWDNTGSTVGSTFLYDPLEPDTVDPEDQDPVVVAAFNTAAWLYTGFNNTTGAQAYWRKNLSGEIFSPIGAGYYCIRRSSDDVLVIPKDCGRSPYGKWERNLPLPYIRGGTDGADIYTGVGYKGCSSVFRWKMGAWLNGMRRSHRVANDRIVLGDVILPWPPSVTPVWST